MAKERQDPAWMQPPDGAGERDPAAEAVAAVSAILGTAEEADALRRRRRVALAAGAAIVLAGAAALFLAGSAPRSGVAMSRNGVALSVEGGQLLAPLAPARDRATGEEVAPFGGFAVSVETDPPGALVTIAGVARGEAPAVAGVDCAPGQDVEIRAVKPGWGPAVRTTRCRADTLVKVRLRLPAATR